MPLALAALIGWTLFAFAGAYRWTVVPAMAGVCVLVVLVRPRILSTPHRAVDRILVALLAAIGLQLVPLPVDLRDWLSPAAADLDARLRIGGGHGATATLSADVGATAWAFALSATLVMLFWVVRAQFERQGLRRVTRAIAWIGSALAVVVFVQRYASPHLIYGFWAPITRTANPTPFGPYVNRNDLATWLLLAVPLVLGYAISRVAGLVRGGRWRQSLEDMIDPRSLFLAGSTVMMVSVLVASLSRSGLVGLLSGLLALVGVARTRLGMAGSRLLVGLCGAVVMLALPFTNLSAMAARLGDTLPADVGGRVAIWHDAWQMARAFITTGVGAGAFERGMLVYQHAPRTLFFNHAHNEYLQVLAEGGLLLAVPAAALALVVLGMALRRLHDDQTAVFWFRLGALAGLVGVAVQSVWDTGLQMPANAVLLAVVSAIALHEGDGRSR